MRTGVFKWNVIDGVSLDNGSLGNYVRLVRAGQYSGRVAALGVEKAAPDCVIQDVSIAIFLGHNARS
jgi:hypothetical protein